ncbi:2-oxo-4-hydroxy-4-carboxy-5-ureidoimidazoline decarboxylase [Nitrincola alkalilacustris]|uniref:2-oxo-4-hydroxy-4-carboxy-5-ureidoimidazoline decarboxylase n=1 Tax=Nitrincola alkalilacustris TaxID=1571224 RepID=UPI00124F74C2|nr:2-oxo-4-hydroxy-4-carboxy-5-ureidoimidazoline decarboxylase [Nitrincola alkalilacustris]
MSQFKTIKPSQLNREEFVSTFADIYEHSPWVAETVYDQVHDLADQSTEIDLDDIETLHQQMCDVLLNASHEAQLALINAHPDLAGKAAIRGELTQSSTDEQAGAGIHACSEEEFKRFSELNDAYKAKFGFPFIMAVKGSNRYQILEAFEKRIHHSQQDEFKQALSEINKIALFRLQQL